MNQIIEYFRKQNLDIIICESKTINNTFIPLLIIHETGFYIFFNEDISVNKEKVLNEVYNLQMFFNTSRLNFYIFGITENETLYLNPFSDDVSLIEDLGEQLDSLLNSGSYTIDENKMLHYKEKMNMILDEGKKVKTDDEGNTYVRRGSRWFPASTEDPDELFRITLFGGLFGLHKFKQGKVSAGIGYLLTLGVLGIGWTFDLLYLVLGIGKDNEGLYYQPVSNKKVKAVITLVCLFLSYFIVKFYSFALIHIITGITNVIQPIISSFF